MSKHKYLKYRMLEIQWVYGFNDYPKQVRNEVCFTRRDNDTDKTLGNINVVVRRMSGGYDTLPVELITADGWILQQVIIPDPLRDPHKSFGLFAKTVSGGDTL